MWRQTCEWFRRSTWASYLHRLLGLCLLLAVAAKLSGRTGLGSTMVSFVLLAIGTKEAAEFDVNGGRAWRCWRETGSAWRAVAGYVPPEIKGWARVARRLLGAVWRPPVARGTAPGARLHTYLSRSSHTALMPMLMLSSLVEIPLVHGIIHVSHQLTPSGRLAGHLTMLMVHVLAFWVLWGDSRWLRADLGHRSSRHGLQLRLGARARGDLAWCDVQDVQIWRPANSRAAKLQGAGVISPLDRPNVRLRLRAGAAGRWERRGERQPWPSELYLYVDDPAALVAEVQRHLDTP
jgi:hypothetical protein